MNPSKVKCPKCQFEFSPDEAYSHQLADSIKKEFEETREKEREEERKKMMQWKSDLEKSQEEKEIKLKQSLEIQLKKSLLEENALEQKQLKEELELRKKQVQEAKALELEFLKKQEQFEERERNLELEVKKQLIEEKAKITETAEKRVKDEYQLTLAEKEKLLTDALKMNEDLTQKLTQKSQQLQGEVQELEIERMLKEAFPFDEITEIKKGVNGADTLEIVRDHTGRECGSILWESKRTKDWKHDWIGKLKDDMRKSKSDIGIIVSDNLPKGVDEFGPFEGTFVTNFFRFIALAQVMRIKIIDLYYAKLSVEGKNDKKEILWQYLTGNEFKQRVEAIVEAFNSMKQVLDKEKQYFNKKWAQEEKLIDRVISQTIGIHGDLQGLMGASLPQIESLEMENFELIETTQIKISDNTATVVTTTMTQTSTSD